MKSLHNAFQENLKVSRFVLALKVIYRDKNCKILVHDTKILFLNNNKSKDNPARRSLDGARYLQKGYQFREHKNSKISVKRTEVRILPYSTAVASYANAIILSLCHIGMETLY